MIEFNLVSEPPLSLYIHLPWCVKKCPYCDFNSHQLKGSLPEELYVAALLDELTYYLSDIKHRQIKSIFFGGGTPSLFSAQAIETILQGIAKVCVLANDIEITLEANPGTTDEARFRDFRLAGVNRLSIGVQSFNSHYLKALGRIHDGKQAHHAIDVAQKAGFDRFNLDLMYGLPEQTIAEAIFDLQTACSYAPSHLSWYQLTLEPNTLFYHHPPVCPDEELICDMQEAGQALLAQSGLRQYEISAYAREGRQCKHNLNYWEFGDYLGIGAGAHSKLTLLKQRKIVRYQQVKHPKDYLAANKRRALQPHIVSAADLSFEFMLNVLRLVKGVPATLFEERTGLDLSVIKLPLAQAVSHDLLEPDLTYLQTTEKGRQFLNDLVALFLPA